MDSKDLLRKNASVLRLLQREHELSSRRYEKLSWKLGLPAVVLSSITGAAIFANGKDKLDFDHKVAVAGISITAAVLSAVQTFLDCPQRAARHRAAAKGFAALSSKTASVLTQQSDDGSMAKVFTEIQTEQDKIYAEAPSLRESTTTKIHLILDEIYADLGKDQ
ncbi:MAG: SLATT domain-containing protein [Verrucomicrobiota bacterium]